MVIAILHNYKSLILYMYNNKDTEKKGAAKKTLQIVFSDVSY